MIGLVLWRIYLKHHFVKFRKRSENNPQLFFNDISDENAKFFGSDSAQRSSFICSFCLHPGFRRNKTRHESIQEVCVGYPAFYYVMFENHRSTFASDANQCKTPQIANQIETMFITLTLQHSLQREIVFNYFLQSFAHSDDRVLECQRSLHIHDIRLFDGCIRT